jgi:hypothetical protein
MAEQTQRMYNIELIIIIVVVIVVIINIIAKVLQVLSYYLQQNVVVTPDVSQQRVRQSLQLVILLLLVPSNK